MEHSAQLRREWINAIVPVDCAKESRTVDDFPAGTMVVYKGYIMPVGIVVSHCKEDASVQVLWSVRAVNILRITSSGSVGIGGIAPAAQLRIE